MVPFRRRNRAGAQQVPAEVAKFWSWWVGRRDEVAAAADDDSGGRVRALVAPRVRDVHADLHWNVGPGVHAQNMLVLSAADHPTLRPLTERWRLAGPPNDATWEYHPAAPAEPDAFAARVVVGDHEIDPAEAAALVRTDDRRCRLDLTVSHPVFGQLDDVGRRRVARVLVGWALGDDEIDRWIGRIETSKVTPLDSVPVSMLGSVTAQLFERWGGDRWSMLEGSFGDRRLIASVRHPLHRVDHPLFDEHLAVRLPYRDAAPDGLPTERALNDLLAFEESLVFRLGSSALLVAQQTTSGERLLHFYADSTASPAATLRTMVCGYLGSSASVQAQYDPAWQGIDHLRT